MTPLDVSALACPTCLGDLIFEGTLSGGHLERGSLLCEACERAFPVRDGLPELVDEASVRELDRLMRFVYDRIAPFHDAATEFLHQHRQDFGRRRLLHERNQRLEVAEG